MPTITTCAIVRGVASWDKVRNPIEREHTIRAELVQARHECAICFLLIYTVARFLARRAGTQSIILSTSQRQNYNTTTPMHQPMARAQSHKL